MWYTKHVALWRSFSTCLLSVLEVAMSVAIVVIFSLQVSAVVRYQHTVGGGSYCFPLFLLVSPCLYDIFSDHMSSCVHFTFQILCLWRIWGGTWKAYVWPVCLLFYIWKCRRTAACLTYILSKIAVGIGEVVFVRPAVVLIIVVL